MSKRRINILAVLVLPFFLLPVLGSAATVTANIHTCLTLGTYSVGGSGGCSLSFGDPYSPNWTYSSAYTNGGANIVGNTINAYVGTEVQVASAVVNNTSSGLAYISFWDEFYVDGPVRPGLLEISAGGLVNSGSANTWSFSTGSSQIISGGCGSNVCSSLNNFWIPVTLGGNTFSFTASSQSSISADYGGPDDIHSVADISVDLTFFEADGITPVIVFDVAPEPNSCVLLALGVSGFAFRRAKPNSNL